MRLRSLISDYTAYDIVKRYNLETFEVEIFEEDKFFLADIDREGDTFTEEVGIEEIEKKLSIYAYCTKPK